MKIKTIAIVLFFINLLFVNCGGTSELHVIPVPLKSNETIPITSTRTDSSNTSFAAPSDTSFPIEALPTIQEPIWSSDIEVMGVISSERVVWAPHINAFLYSTCPSDSFSEVVEGSIIQAGLEDGLSHVTIAENFICPAYASEVAWSPDGQKILFTGFTLDEIKGLDYVPETGNIWLVEEDQNLEILLTAAQVTTRGPSFRYWLDDNRVVYSGYGGGGYVNSAILNIEENTRSQLIVLHACGLRGFSSEYLVGCNGNFETADTSVFYLMLDALDHAAFDLNDETISEDDLFFNQPHYNYLNQNETALFTGNSRFLDWLPNHNEMLVLTWAEGLDLERDAPVETQIQLWDVAEDSLQLLVDNGQYGRFSPDGRFLAYVAPVNGLYQIYLLDRSTDSVLLSKPIVVYQEEGLVEAHFSFSADGRYFTSTTHLAKDQGMLEVYDLVSRQEIASFSVQSRLLSWSPTNEQFVYQNQNGNLALYDVRTGFPSEIIENSIPSRSIQWSYDGQFMSAVFADKTVIIAVP